MKQNKGQSLIEVLVAIAVFVVVISTLSFLVLDSYTAGRIAKQITKANFLAEEGIEAARSIRDNNWDDLSIVTTHGLDSSGGQWVFSEASDDLSSDLKAGAVRVITIENIDTNTKKITSEVTWNFTEGRPQSVKLVTYFTNWAKLMPFLAQASYRFRNDDGTE